jgi:hypothetical protein
MTCGEIMTSFFAENSFNKSLQTENEMMEMGVFTLISLSTKARLRGEERKTNERRDDVDNGEKAADNHREVKVQRSAL